MRTLLRIDLPEELAHLAGLRRAAREVLASFSVSSQDAEDLELILSELATNAVIHARSGQHYRVELAVTGAGEQRTPSVVVMVADQGIGFLRETVPPPGTPRTDISGSKERLGGWGLPMVEMLSDSVEYLPNQPQGTVVKAVKHLSLAPCA